MQCLVNHIILICQLSWGYLLLHIGSLHRFQQLLKSRDIGYETLLSTVSSDSLPNLDCMFYIIGHWNNKNAKL